MEADARPNPESPPPTTGETLPRWELRALEIGIFFGLLFASIVAFSSLGHAIGAWFVAEEDRDASILVPLLEGLGVQMGLLVAYLGLKAMAGDPPRSTSPRPSNGRCVAIGLKWLLFTYPAMILVSIVWQGSLRQLGYEQVVQEPVKLVQQGGELMERALMYTMILVVAPICEELVFRGTVFRYLHQRTPMAVAAGVSGILFAAIHFNLYSFAPLVIMGAGLALAYRQSGNLLSSMAFHATFNGISLVLILIAASLE